jgi:hypothetical protein
MIHKIVLFMMLFISTHSFSGPLKVGVGISGPPLVETVNNAQGTYYFGFCIDLMNEICNPVSTKP